MSSDNLLFEVQQMTDELIAKSKENLDQEIVKAKSYQKGFEDGCVRLGKQLQTLIKEK